MSVVKISVEFHVPGAYLDGTLDLFSRLQEDQLPPFWLAEPLVAAVNDRRRLAWRPEVGDLVQDCRTSMADSELNWVPNTAEAWTRKVVHVSRTKIVTVDSDDDVNQFDPGSGDFLFRKTRQNVMTVGGALHGN